eukprot:m51a1_g10084 hypothetical protein (584) ;mRNA; r:68336-70219
MQQRTDPFEALTHDALRLVLAHLDARSLGRLSRASRAARAACLASAAPAWQRVACGASDAAVRSLAAAPAAALLGALHLRADPTALAGARALSTRAAVALGAACAQTLRTFVCDVALAPRAVTLLAGLPALEDVQASCGDTEECARALRTLGNSATGHRLRRLCLRSDRCDALVSGLAQCARERGPLARLEELDLSSARASLFVKEFSVSEAKSAESPESAERALLPALRVLRSLEGHCGTLGAFLSRHCPRLETLCASHADSALVASLPCLRALLADYYHALASVPIASSLRNVSVVCGAEDLRGLVEASSRTLEGIALHFGSAARADLCEAVAALPRLRELSIDSSGITAGEGAAFALAMSRSPARLVKLSIHGDAGPVLAPLLSAPLCASLECLESSGDNVLDLAAVRCERLRELYLWSPEDPAVLDGLAGLAARAKALGHVTLCADVECLLATAAAAQGRGWAALGLAPACELRLMLHSSLPRAPEGLAGLAGLVAGARVLHVGEPWGEEAPAWLVRAVAPMLAGARGLAELHVHAQVSRKTAELVAAAIPPTVAAVHTTCPALAECVRASLPSVALRC